MVEGYVCNSLFLMEVIETEKFKRKKVGSQERGSSLTLEQLKQNTNVKFEEIYDYLDMLYEDSKFIFEYKYKLKITRVITSGGIITIPCGYKVGANVLDVYLNGLKLLLSSDDVGSNGHYREVGAVDSISNQIKLTSDWGISQEDITDGRVFEFVVRENYKTLTGYDKDFYMAKEYSGDLNELRITSFVYATGNCFNTPLSGYAFYVETIGLNDNFIYQKAKINTSNVNNFTSYERRCYAGQWSEWRIAGSKSIALGVEFKTGRIIDGKEEYAKRIDCGNLPNKTTKVIAHGLTNVTPTRIEGIAISTPAVSDKVFLPLPYIGILGATENSISLDMLGGNIRISASLDRSGFKGYVTVYYVKN